jgi:hypothetical protein
MVSIFIPYFACKLDVGLALSIRKELQVSLLSVVFCVAYDVLITHTGADWISNMLPLPIFSELTWACDDN